MGTHLQCLNKILSYLITDMVEAMVVGEVTHVVVWVEVMENLHGMNASQFCMRTIGALFERAKINMLFHYKISQKNKLVLCKHQFHSAIHAATGVFFFL